MTLKLRASRGGTGNQQIADFGSRTLATANPYAGVAGLAPSQLGNPNLRWERTTETDLGADLGVFNGRINLVVDWYNRATTDLLVNRPVAATSGYTTVADNVGSLRNRGVDLQLQTVNIRRPGTNGFEWTSDINITWNRNLITALSDGQPVNSTTSGRLTSVAMVGKPVDLTYEVDQLGDSAVALSDLLAGKGAFASTLKAAKKPAILVGTGALSRADGAAVGALASQVALA
jgi:outer membrane receptor protein involved in Fe transport